MPNLRERFDEIARLDVCNQLMDKLACQYLKNDLIDINDASKKFADFIPKIAADAKSLIQKETAARKSIL